MCTFSYSVRYVKVEKDPSNSILPWRYCPPAIPARSNDHRKPHMAHGTLYRTRQSRNSGIVSVMEYKRPWQVFRLVLAPADRSTYSINARPGAAEKSTGEERLIVGNSTYYSSHGAVLSTILIYRKTRVIRNRPGRARRFRPRKKGPLCAWARARWQSPRPREEAQTRAFLQLFIPRRWRIPPVTCIPPRSSCPALCSFNVFIAFDIWHFRGEEPGEEKKNGVAARRSHCDGGQVSFFLRDALRPSSDRV